MFYFINIWAMFNVKTKLKKKKKVHQPADE